MKVMGVFFAAAIWLILAYIYLESGILGDSVAALPGYLSLFFRGGGDVGAIGIIRAMMAPHVPVAAGALVTSAVFGLLNADRSVSNALYMLSVLGVSGFVAHSYFFRYVRLYSRELENVDFGLFGLMFLLFAPLAVLGGFLALVNGVNRRADASACVRLAALGALYAAVLSAVNSAHIIRDFNGTLISQVVGAVLAIAVISFITGIFAIISLLPAAAILCLTRRIFPAKFVLTDA